MFSAYREGPPRAELRDCAACVWTDIASGDPTGVVPDGCVDVVWAPEHEPWVAGPDTSSRSATVAKGTLQVGVRLLPGNGAPLVRVPVSEITNRYVPIRDLLSKVPVRSLCRRLSDCNSAGDAIAALERATVELLADADEPDPLIRAAVASILQGVAFGEGRAPSLADRCGISERQLRRRFVAAIGYGPKLFERVARFQYFRRLAKARGAALRFADLAADAGYADQPHLTRECVAIAGQTPRSLLAKAPMSDLFKTLELAPAMIAA